MERIKKVMETYGFSYVEDLDDALKGNESLFNWSQDVEMKLLKASSGKRELLKERMDFCREYLSKSKQTDDLNSLVRHRVVAESHFMLGRPEEGERLFNEHVHQFPEDAYGWINWSDQYGLFAESEHILDYDKAIAILKQGLEEPGLDERVVALARLVGTYEEAGMEKEAEDTKPERESVERKKRENESEQLRKIKEKIQQEVRTKSAINQETKNEAVKQKKLDAMNPVCVGAGRSIRSVVGHK